MALAVLSVSATGSMTTEARVSLLGRDLYGSERDAVVREYAAWMSALRTRADLPLRRRAAVTSEGAALPMMLAVNDELARVTVVRALNRLNGRAVRSPRRAAYRPRLDALAWLERGDVSGQPHVHALIERPAFLAPDVFAEMVRAAWAAQPFGHGRVCVAELRDRERSVGYNSKAASDVTGDLVYFHREPAESAWWRYR
jgi:hypothetical protein